MQTFCHNAGGCLQRQRTAEGTKEWDRNGETPPFHENPLLHIVTACVQLLKGHTGSSDALWIYTALINLPHRRGNKGPVTERVKMNRLERRAAPSCAQRKHWHDVHCSRAVMTKVWSVEHLDLYSYESMSLKLRTNRKMLEELLMHCISFL